MNRGARIPRIPASVRLALPFRFALSFRIVGSIWFALSIWSAASPAGAEGQDVELLGRIHGTRPPPAYFDRLRSDPDAFQFGRAWSARLEAAIEAREAGDLPAARSEVGGGAPLRTPLGLREGGVSGLFRFPVVLGLYQDSPSLPPVGRQELQGHLFDGPNPSGTVSDYFARLSGGKVEVRGVTFDWIRTGLSEAEVAGGTSGLAGPARVGDFVVELLEALDRSGVDWSQFDNDGPDGLPDSGDDDGFVDLLAVIHPTWGSECGGDAGRNRVWSHRYRLSAWGGGPFVTSTPAAGGGFIKIDDYTIQPALSCLTVAGGRPVNEIGVFAHELGHGFGLPDLYGTTEASPHFGAGNWDLMATGTWGCAGNNPARPCGLGAWSRAVLGWVEVVDLPPGTPPTRLTLPPSLDEHLVWRLRGEGETDDYLLLENRQRVGPDGEIFAPGLLVWQVDPERTASRWRSNSVNADPGRMGVQLRQADGDDALTRPGGGRGDAGDPFPGATGNRWFHYATTPAARAADGAALGISLLEITRSGGDVLLTASTYSPLVTLRETGHRGGGFVLDSVALPAGDEAVFRSAPFRTHRVEAVPGPETEPGLRAGFLGWDGLDARRTQQVVVPLADTTLVARYGGAPEARLKLRIEGGIEGWEAGEIIPDPPGEEGWFRAGQEVSLEAVPRQGFRFREWVGIEPRENPLRVEVDGPSVVTAAFETAYRVQGPEAPVVTEAGRASEVVLVASHANPPVAWSVVSGRLPDGMALDAAAGRVAGEPLETGSFRFLVAGRDAIGLHDEVPVELEVRAPVLAGEALAGPLLGRPGSLTEGQRNYLDRIGNGNGRYDVGDLRAYLRTGGGQ